MPDLAAPVALEQAYRQIGLELAELMRDGGFGQAERLGGIADAPEAGRRMEGAQRVKRRQSRQIGHPGFSNT